MRSYKCYVILFGQVGWDNTVITRDTKIEYMPDNWYRDDKGIYMRLGEGESFDGIETIGPMKLEHGGIGDWARSKPSKND